MNSKFLQTKIKSERNFLSDFSFLSATVWITNEWVTICALTICGVCFVCSDFNNIEWAITLWFNIILAVSYCAFDAFVHFHNKKSSQKYLLRFQALSEYRFSIYTFWIKIPCFLWKKLTKLLKNYWTLCISMV